VELDYNLVVRLLYIISVDSAFTAGINISGSVDDRIVGGFIGNVKGNASGSGHDNQ
jgi:hypothetical protein